MIKRVRTGARLPERIAALGGKSMSLVMPELNRKVLSRRNDIRCGTTIENYGFMLRADAKYATKAARVSALARDNSELLQDGALPAGDGHRLIVAYHAACSLQHRHQITAPVKLLLPPPFLSRTPAAAH